MNSKSFIFGKNYDSDYLCGKQFKRKNCGHNYDRNYRKRRRMQLKDDNPFNKRYKTLDKIRKYPKKTYDNRLTMKSMTADSSGDEYHKNDGLYANGKASNVVNNKWILNDKRQLNARFKEDLFWILHKNQKRSELEECRPQRVAQRDRRMIRHRPKYKEKATKNSSTIDLEENSSEEELEPVPYDVRHQHRSNGLSQTKNSLIVRSYNKIGTKSVANGSTKLRVKNKLNFVKPNDYSRSDRLKTSQLSQKIDNQSLPTSLKIVQNLMNGYESQRKALGKSIPEFSIDLMVKIIEELKQISKSKNQSIEQNLFKQNHKRDKQTSFGPEVANQVKITAIPSDDCLSLVPYNQKDTRIVFKHLEPGVRNMLSKLLLNISEAFHSLSSKCVDKSFFE